MARKGTAQSDKNMDDQSILSKDMVPFGNFGPIFFNNQFRTTIPLPTREMFPTITGKCAIITGSNTGLGVESARQLLSLGLAHLVMGVRSVDKGKAAAAKLRTANTSAKIDVWDLDMDSYDSIQAFALRCETLSQIDFVILNSGCSPVQFTTVPATTHEKTIQVNHLSTALLTILLLPILKSKSKSNTINQTPPTLTIVNSVTAHLAKFPNKANRPLLPSFDTPEPWDPNDRYGTSKLLSQLFTVKLADLIDPSDVTINMVDPGLTKGTGLARDATGMLMVAAKVFFAVAGRPVERGAATYVDAVVKKSESHGCFLMNCRVAP